MNDYYDRYFGLKNVLNNFDLSNTLENSIDISIEGTMLTLLPQKAVYFRKEYALLVSDIHFGKTGHFRNAGIPVPSEVAFADFEILSELLLDESLNIKKLIVLGDMFHAKLNSDWKIFQKWREIHCDIEIHLIKGNHDVLSDSVYESANIKIFSLLILNNLLLVHNHRDGDNSANGLYKICGHIHPAVRIHGKAKQGITLPCFYFGESTGILPAFGRFTGRKLISPSENAVVFVTVDHDGEQKVVKI